MSINSLREVHVFLFADREVRLNRIDLRDRGQHSRWADKISDLHLSDPNDPVYQGCDISEAEVEVGLFHLRLSSLHCCFGSEVCLNVVVQLALRYGALLGQRCIPVDIELSLAQVGLCLRELRFCLVKDGLKGPRVNPEKSLALPDKRTFLVALLDDVTTHLRLDLRVYVAI